MTDLIWKWAQSNVKLTLVTFAPTSATFTFLHVRNGESWINLLKLISAIRIFDRKCKKKRVPTLTHFYASTWK